MYYVNMNKFSIFIIILSANANLTENVPVMFCKDIILSYPFLYMFFSVKTHFQIIVLSWNICHFTQFSEQVS